MKALIIIDVQNDFLPGGALPVPEGDQIIPIINHLQEKFDFIVASKDWHPPNHISFASRHDKKKPFETIKVHGREQELWPDHCVQNTWGSEFSPNLKTDKIVKVFYKGTDPEVDSYSAFYDNEHQRSTGLGEYLKEQDVDKIYIVGLATDFCVKYSISDAIELDFKISVILGGCRAINPQKTGKIIEEFKKQGVEFIVDELY